jgi:hypothetical protein
MPNSYQTEIHDSEIFLLYKGSQAGILFPSPEFPIAKIREAVATLNQAEPATEGYTRRCDCCGPEFDCWSDPRRCRKPGNNPPGV